MQPPFFNLLSIHHSSIPGSTLSQPSAHLFPPPSSYPNPSHPKQLWSPLYTLHPVLAQSQFNPHLNLILPTPSPSLSPHVTGRPNQLSGRLAALPPSQPLFFGQAWSAEQIHHIPQLLRKVKQVLMQLGEMHLLNSSDCDFDTQEKQNLAAYT